MNFILWAESIEVTKDDQTRYMERVLKGGYSIFAKAYTAFIVDYRLICCILFLEDAIKIDKTIAESEAKNRQPQDDPTEHHTSLTETPQSGIHPQTSGANENQMQARNPQSGANPQTPDPNQNHTQALSHQIAAKPETPDPNQIDHLSFKEYRQFKSRSKFLKGLGVISGLVIVFLQIFNAMVYTGNNRVAPSANLVACAATWSFFIAGVFLLMQVK